MQYTDSFQQFTRALADALQLARTTGVGQQQIVARAEDVGDWLNRTVPPVSPEQRLLKELWDASTDQEQQAIASALVKMIQKRAPGLH